MSHSGGDRPAPGWRPCLARSAPWLLGALFAIQLCVLLYMELAGEGRSLVGDEARYLRHAREFAGLAAATEWLWLWPPLQVWFLGALGWIGGADAIRTLAVPLQLLLLAASALFLRAIWRHFDPRPAAGTVAALLLLLNPSVLAYGFWMWPEPLHLFLMLGGLALLLRAARGRGDVDAAVPPRSSESGSVFSAAGGVAIGLAILAKSLLTALIWFIPLLLWRRDGLRRWLQRTLAFALGALLVLIPVWLHGARESGRPIIADSAPFNLVVGLHDQRLGDYIEPEAGPLLQQYLAAGGDVHARNAAFRQRAIATVERQGLAETALDQAGRQYFRLFNARTLLVSMLPGPRCAGQLSAYDIGPGLAAVVRGWTMFLHALLLTAAACGLVLWRGWLRPSGLWMLAFFGLQLGLFLLLHVKARFLLPMLPLLGGFAASAAVTCREAMRSRPDGLARDFAPTRGRIWLGLLLAALLLFLAFGGPLLDPLCR